MQRGSRRLRRRLDRRAKAGIIGFGQADEAAVARLAEDAYGRLDEAQQQAARIVFERLAGEDPDGAVVRRRLPLSELVSWWANIGTTVYPQDEEQRSLYERLFLNNAVLNPVDEAPGVSTNATAQWGLAAIECLAYARR